MELKFYNERTDPLVEPIVLEPEQAAAQLASNLFKAITTNTNEWQLGYLFLEGERRKFW